MTKLGDTIRKFGLEHSDLPTMISNVSVMLRVLTLNIDSRYKKRIPIIFYILSYFCIASYYYTYFVSLLWFLFVKCVETGDVVAAMVAMSLGVSSEIGTFKLLFMYSKVKKIRRVVEQYLEHDALTEPDSRFSRNLTKSLRRVKKRALSFWIVMMVNAVAYNIMPAFIPGRHLQEDLYVVYGLEPMFESPNYEIALLLTGVNVTFICFASASVTAFIIIIAGYTESQMLSLSVELTNIWDDALQETYLNTFELKIEFIANLFQNNRIEINERSKQEINREVKKKLVQLIKNHSRNIRLLYQVEDIFRISIAVGFVFLVIGLIAELLGGLENTFLQIPFTLSQVAIDSSL